MTTADEFEAEYGSPVFQSTFQAFAEGLDGNGILDSGDLQVTAGATSNGLDIASTTRGLLYGGTVYTYGGGSDVLTLSANSSGSDRWDLVYFDTGTTSPGKREGTPGAKPDLPLLQAGEFPLAAVYVADGQTDVADTDIRSLRVHVADASETYVDDSPGLYAGDTVESALTSELQYAAQLTGYPLPLADLNSPYPPASIASVNAYPFANSDLANSIITVTAGTALTGGGAVGLGGSTTLDVSGVTTSEITNGTLLDEDIDSSTTISRGKLDTTKTTTTVSSSIYTSSDEEVIFVDTVTIAGASTISLASSDAVDGNTIVVTDLTGSARDNPITVDTEGSETIAGVSSKAIETNGGALVFTSDGTNWSLGGGGAGGGGADPAEVFEGRESGNVSDTNQGILVIDNLADGETVEVYKAALTLADGQAAPTNLNLELVTLDNAGNYTPQTTLITGDGSTVYDDETGDPLGTYTNGTGSAQSIGVVVDNGTGFAQDIMAVVEGQTGL